jgi:16S rRNA C1402 N4-methylase RsmH
MSSEHKVNLSKLTDYEISMLTIERNACNYKAEKITELLNKVGESKELTNIASSNEKEQAQQLPGSKDLNELPWKSYKTKEKAQKKKDLQYFIALCS